MTLLEDTALLRRYADDRSEAAFAELVRRHLTPVYAFALRRVGGDEHLAEDVTQVVFAALARKASALTERPVLGGWLCRTTHFAARDVVRAERRRRAREQEAHVMHESSTDGGTHLDWEKLQPVLDQTLGELNDADRDAVWLRFFEGRSFAEVGARLRLTENAARMRVERALDKLHAALGRRGITSTAAAVGVALAQQATAAVPAGMAASVTSAALMGVSVAAAGGAGVGMTFLTMSKIKIGIVGAVAVAGGAGLLGQAAINRDLRDEIVALARRKTEVAVVRAENVALTRAAADADLLRVNEGELERLRGEVQALQQRTRTAAAVRPPPAPEVPLPVSGPGQPVNLHLPDVDLDTALSTLALLMERKIVRDPSLRGLPIGAINVSPGRITKGEAVELVRAALGRLGMTLEESPEGHIVARRTVGR